MSSGIASVPHRVQRRLAIQRWFVGPWAKLDGKVKASIVEGIVVFLSLFDENPEVYRSFCPPRSAYTEEPQPGQPRPLPPLDELLETGHVLGLNFPVALNPALARGLGVETTAEGVETEAQAHVMRGLGCTQLQGFFFGRPVVAERIERAVEPPARRIAS